MNMNFCGNMNNMNMNCFNNNRPQGMMNLSSKTIVNNSLINETKDTTFFNATLQVFANIDCIKMWIQRWNTGLNLLNTNPKLKLTKEIYNLIISFNQVNFPDSSNFILNYLNKVKSLTPNKIEDAVNFLYYLIQILHHENNLPKDPNQNLNSLNHLTLAQRLNEDFMRNIFYNLYQQTQNSIFSENFFNIIKSESRCNNCSIKYFYEYKYMIKFYINDYINHRNQAYPMRSNVVLNLTDCFDCYTGGVPYTCDVCGNHSAKNYTSIYSFAKILIIGLYRTNHSYRGDLDFTNNLNLYGYCSQNNSPNVYFTLKAVISMNNQGQTFSDIKLNNGWFRYYLNQIRRLNDNIINTELKSFEPQVLIYEACSNCPMQMSYQNFNRVNPNMMMGNMGQMNPQFNFGFHY